MKLKHIALAGALAVVGAAQAAPLALTAANLTAAKKIDIGGASAQDPALKVLIGTNICGGATTFNVASGNYYGFLCTASGPDAGALAGKNLLILKTSEGGSFSGVGPVIHATVLAKFLNKATLVSSCVGPAPTYTSCAIETTAATVPMVGFSDVEGAVFGESVSPTFTGLALQAFGVAVSNKLYDALAAKQFTAAVCPAGSYTTDTTGACQPSVSAADVFGVFADVGGTVVNWTPLLGTVAGAGQKITACRRADTSGTQKGAELFFMSNPTASGALGGAAIPAIGTSTNTAGDLSTAALETAFIGEVNSTSDKLVFAGSGTGDLKKCMTDVNNGGAAGKTYAMGYLSMENTPGGADAWHFVKLNGVSPNFYKGAVDANQRNNLIDGTYLYGFESVAYVGTTGVTTTESSDLVSKVVSLLADPTKYPPLKGLAVVPGAFFANSDPTVPKSVATWWRGGNNAASAQSLNF